MDTVIIGCKLPNGLTLEVGLEPATVGGAPKKGPNYARVVLKGWHHNNPTILLPRDQRMIRAQSAPSAYLNFNVPAKFWERWKAEHKDSWLLKKGHLFEAADPASANSRKKESEQAPTILGALDPSKKHVEGVTARTD